MQKQLTDYEALKDLDRMLIHIAKSDGPGEALRLARNTNASNRVLATLEKATAPAADTAGIGATALGNSFGEFYSQARQIGAADAMSIRGENAEGLWPLQRHVEHRGEFRR